MIFSIRKFLLINLLLSITITTTLTVIGNYLLDQEDIQHHLDSLLSQSGLAFQALTSGDLNARNLTKLQHKLNAVPNTARQYYETIDNPFDYNYEDKFQFQVWDNKNNKLLFHSANAPLEPLSNGEDGFSTRKINGQTWRVFTTIDKDSDTTINITERYDVRAELGKRISRDDLYIMLLIYPLLGLLIWIIIGKGLNPLIRIAGEVSNRAPGHLQPVKLSSVPIEIKPLIDELNQLFLRLQKALDREKRFSADAAHELRTPLAALKTQTQLAIKLTNEEDRAQALNKIISSVDRCTHIVEQLLTLSRLIPEEPHLIQDISKVNLYNLAIEIITMLVPKAIEKNIELELICTDESLYVEGNNTALGILLRNLIDNAIRYSPDESFVKVEIMAEHDNIILSVTDNGPGIPAELRSRVFERFFRVLGNKAPGSGLGLAIVQQIANLHQAMVRLGPPPSGNGLQVTIIFPKKLKTRLNLIKKLAHKKKKTTE